MPPALRLRLGHPLSPSRLRGDGRSLVGATPDAGGDAARTLRRLRPPPADVVTVLDLGSIEQLEPAGIEALRLAALRFDGCGRCLSAVDASAELKRQLLNCGLAAVLRRPDPGALAVIVKVRRRAPDPAG
ncbi:hypothetical protein [Dermatobacter hominis]|uniref:hypothetical protein n=1 Tax=Dermatobacter hominis TaxID=2884263 RepID=UPI001D0FD7AF|nr:hypothetical protein [Dermatobacter hominis]UDY37555.1 hypothetical protein LH044_08440 [Dermatobacter hominis]